ncbi:MAG: GNAT family N-acetyltransferase [Solirubrobacterales bacterium]|nr:GNAT family N-acetyltransferase [Solirubrobacterales bacterium]
MTVNRELTGASGSAAPQLRVREMELAEVGIRIDYFHDASDEYLRMLGVERARLLSREAWREFYELDFARPVRDRENYLLAWELDGEVVGMSMADHITFGEQAFMHLHILEPNRRRSGLGTEFVKRTAVVLFEVLELQRLYCQPNAFNVAPNRTLQRAGFRYLFTKEMAPRPTDFPQPMTRWVLDAPPRLS